MDDLTRSVRDRSREIWNDNAVWWAAQIGEGNAFQRTVVNPATDALREMRAGERLLDVACGNGVDARRMARRGVRVTAFDFSERFIDIAKDLGTPAGPAIDYRVIDATDETAVRALGERAFDAAMCNMAVMDLVAIAPLARALAAALAPGGRFVFSVLHPCFNHRRVVFTTRESDAGGVVQRRSALEIDAYDGMEPVEGIGIVGQPRPDLYFDRPLHAMLRPFFEAGFVLNGLEEPLDPAPPDPMKPFAYRNLSGVPPALVARLRLPAEMCSRFD